MSSGNSQEGSPECKSPLLTHPRATRGSKPRPGDIQLLKFSVVSTDGGQYSSNYKCENFLSPDSKVYCTQKKENINIVLKHELEVPFVLTHIIVKAPEHEYSAPIGEGLIFVAHDHPDMVATSLFDNFNMSRYEAMVEVRRQRLATSSDQRSTFWNLSLFPAAYFDLKKDWCIVQKLDVPRSGRYILVKLLRSRNSADNIDIQYMGFRGFVGQYASAYGDLL